MYNAVSVTKNRVVKARSLHGAIASIVIGILLTFMTYMFISVSNTPDLVWTYTYEIVLLCGAGLVSYLVIRFFDLWFLKLEKDWCVDADSFGDQEDNSTAEPPEQLG